MKSRTTKEFRQCLGNLPSDVIRQAMKAYRLWRANPSHPSLQFKQIHVSRGIWSVRVALGWRALGVTKGGDIVWFWIGSHAEYDRLVGR